MEYYYDKFVRKHQMTWYTANPYISSKDINQNFRCKGYYRKNTDYIKIVLNGFIT